MSGVSADDFTFETVFVPADTGSGRLYTSTLTGPHGTVQGTGDTGACAATRAADAYRAAFAVPGRMAGATG